MNRQPNIVFIVADDLGYADLSCCGQTDFQTPELDKMAAEGTRFTQSYANSPLCTNTRTALITGRYQYRFKLGLTEPLRHSQKGDPELGLPPEHPTLPSLLRDAGYQTALIGKWHVGALPHFGPLKSGYDEFQGVMGGYTGYFTQRGDGGVHDFYQGESPVEVDGYTTDIFSERAIDYIEKHAADEKPFFLSLHYTAPHWPWSSPSVEAEARERELGPTSGHTEGGSPRIYAEMVQIMDKGIGRVMQTLKQMGIADNTLVIFTSDNGGERYSKTWPFVGRKLDLLEGGLRVPQIVWWPGRVQARVTEQVSITMDLTATCLAAAGVAADDRYPLEGENLLPLLEGGEGPGERTLFWRMRERYQRAVRRGDWKYLKVEEREFLFDLGHDWRERADFSHKRPELLEELRSLWLEWEKDMLPMPLEETPRQAALYKMLW
jgi:arylsulfatase A-like enzyme